MGEARLCRADYCRHREPQRRRLRDLRATIRPSRRPQIRRQHRCPSHRRTLHPRLVHKHKLHHHALDRGTPTDHHDRPARRPPSDPRGIIILRQHPRHRSRGTRTHLSSTSTLRIPTNDKSRHAIGLIWVAPLRARCSASAGPFLAPPMAGTSWSICSSTATLRKSRSNNRRKRERRQLPLARPMLRRLPSGMSPLHQRSVASTLHLRHKMVGHGYGILQGFPSSSTFALGAIDWAAETSGGNDWSAEPAGAASGWDAGAQPTGWD